MIKRSLVILMIVFIFCSGTYAAEAVKIGLSYPKTGEYKELGLDQERAAKMAAEEINIAGGIMGRKVELEMMDSKAEPYTATTNVEQLIEKGCQMIFGGSASSEAIAAGKAAKAKGKLFFGTLTYSNATTREEGHKYIFRECYDAWMGAKVISKYMKEKFAGKTFYFVTADYTWGWTTEDSIRKFSGATDKIKHKRTYTPFPHATEEDFSKALAKAKGSGADVLVLVLFGQDMVTGIKEAVKIGIKTTMSVVVPNLTLRMAEGAGPDGMEGVIGAMPWSWSVPYKDNYEKGKKFVEKFASLNGAYPSTSAASAYTIMYQYKDAVERAGSFDTRPVILALEGHKFTLLKDEQTWRAFDHQNVQTVYAVKCKTVQEVMKDKFKQDYFEIINKMSGDEAAQTQEEWLAARKAAGKPEVLEW